MSSLQTQLQASKEEHTEHTSILLRNQFTSFSEAHKVLIEHFKESNVIEEVLRSWFTHYNQVFQQIRTIGEKIKSLQSQQGDTKEMNKKIQDQLMLETTKLDKL